jgi:hypothetical protein
MLQFLCGTCRVPVFLHRLLLLVKYHWICPISSFVSGRGCCNLCAARVAYLSASSGNFLLRLLLLVGLIQSAALFHVAAVAILCAARVSVTYRTVCVFLLRLFLLVGLIQSAALFQVAAVAICVRYVSRTCRRFGETFCFTCSYWLDLSNQQLCFKSRLLQFVCGTCREPVGGLGKLFASLAPIGWIDPISSFLSGRVCCNLCAARAAYLSFYFACSYWLGIIGSIQSAALFQVAAVVICVL